MATLRVGVDSSVMVAAVCAWHEYHAAALPELESRLGNRRHFERVAPQLTVMVPGT